MRNKEQQEDEVQEYQVKVLIDNNTSVNISVKSVMTSLEFLGLTKKAEQLFKVSNKQGELLGIGKARKYNPRVNWTPEMKTKLTKLCKQKKTLEEIKNDSMFSTCSISQLKSTIYNMGLKPGKKVVED